MPIYNMSTNKWILTNKDYYNQKPSYWESDSDDESIDYPSSDEESEEELELTPKELLEKMLRDINDDKESSDEEHESSTKSKEEATPIQRTQNLRREILGILKRK